MAQEGEPCAPDVVIPDVDICKFVEDAILDAGDFGAGTTYLWSNGETIQTIVVDDPDDSDGDTSFQEEEAEPGFVKYVDKIKLLFQPQLKS